MNIDCTLFAQMLNFFIAYLIMRWLLFRPAIAVIDAESIEKKRIDDTTKSLEASLQSIHTEQEEVWRSFHGTVAHEVSSIQEGDALFDVRIDPVCIESVSIEQQEDLINACAEHLVEKVKYVRK